MWDEKVEVVKHGAKAVLIRYETVEAWIPYSQMLDDSEIYGCEPEEGGTGRLCIPEWLAEEKGLLI